MRTGGCLCGTVRFEADVAPETYLICHCEMCRRWTGSALLGVTIEGDKLHWHGEKAIAERRTSSWAKRAWCRSCGTGLYLKSTLEEDREADITEIPLGLFDDPSGFRPSDEIWIDRNPDSFAFVDRGQTQHTRAECISTMPHFDAQ